MKRKYNVDDNYFDNINTEEKAYWLGFLFADGCIHERSGQNRISLVLAIKDKKHLEKFKKAISFEGPIIDYAKKSGKFLGLVHSYLRITSQKLSDSLSNLGCVPRKSLILKFPKINDDLKHHFIRGYFDGDGSVFISNEKHWRNKKIFPIIHIRFSGTESFLKNINQNILMLGSIKKIKNNNINSLEFKRNKKAKLFYNYLYNNSKVFLERKKEIFEKHLQE